MTSRATDPLADDVKEARHVWLTRAGASVVERLALGLVELDRARERSMECVVDLRGRRNGARLRRENPKLFVDVLGRAR